MFRSVFIWLRREVSSNTCESGIEPSYFTKFGNLKINYLVKVSVDISNSLVSYVGRYRVRYI
jgi:hypothetical protein